MQKRTKHIHLLFIWLTGLMFFAHGITPHHHHFDSVFEHSQQSSHSDEDPDDSPSHCHAFNDLVFVNAGVSTAKVAHNVTSDYITTNDIQVRLDENPVQTTIFLEPDDSLIPIFLDNSPTRGSPLHF